MGGTFKENLAQFQNQAEPVEGNYLAFCMQTKEFILYSDRPAFYKELTEKDLLLVSLFVEGAWHDRHHMVSLAGHLLKMES